MSNILYGLTENEVLKNKVIKSIRLWKKGKVYATSFKDPNRNRGTLFH
jgi:hypothetical protein